MIFRLYNLLEEKQKITTKEFRNKHPLVQITAWKHTTLKYLIFFQSSLAPEGLLLVLAQGKLLLSLLISWTGSVCFIWNTSKRTKQDNNTRGVGDWQTIVPSSVLLQLQMVCLLVSIWLERRGYSESLESQYKRTPTSSGCEPHCKSSGSIIHPPTRLKPPPNTGALGAHKWLPLEAA